MHSWTKRIFKTSKNLARYSQFWWTERSPGQLRDKYDDKLTYLNSKTTTFYETIVCIIIAGRWTVRVHRCGRLSHPGPVQPLLRALRHQVRRTMKKYPNSERIKNFSEMSSLFLQKWKLFSLHFTTNVRCTTHIWDAGLLYVADDLYSI